MNLQIVKGANYKLCCKKNNCDENTKTTNLKVTEDHHQ